MNEDQNPTRHMKHPPRTPGALAERKREELRQFEEARRRREDAIRRKRAELQRRVKDAEAREKRQQTNARRANERRMKFVLGGLVLDRLKLGGLDNLSLTSEHLRILAENDREALTQLLAEMSLDWNGRSLRSPDDAVFANGVDIEV